MGHYIGWIGGDWDIFYVDSGGWDIDFERVGMQGDQMSGKPWKSWGIV